MIYQTTPAGPPGGGQAHPAGKNRSLVWMADFSSYADFEARCLKAELAARIVGAPWLEDVGSFGGKSRFHEF